MPKPEFAILVSSFERPGRLARSLASIAAQKGAPEKLEVVVTDDGSRDETPEVVKRFAASVPFPVTMTTHRHDGFQLARCRNEGVAASSAEKILFLDGDCLLPPDHVAQFARRLRPGLVLAGFCVWLDEATSQRVTMDVVRSGEFVNWAPRKELRNLAALDRKSRFYNLIRHPWKPKLFGGDIGICRQDYEKVNGYDEAFRGWGCEDDDLRVRLRRAGVRIESILRWTHTYHLWHPPAASRPKEWKAGANVSRHQRRARLTACLNGLRKRSLADLRLGLAEGADWAEVRRCLPAAARNAPVEGRGAPEVELAIFPLSRRFSGQADCNILVAPGECSPPPSLLRQADVLIASRKPAKSPAPCFRPDEWEEALRAVA